MRVAGIEPHTNRPITVVTDGEFIVAVEQGINRPDMGSDGLYISPGMIDLMVPGYGGNSFSDTNLSGEMIAAILQKLYKHGTTHIYPLLGSCQAEVYPKVLATIDEFAGNRRMGESIVGLHIEGPYITDQDGPRGAHRKKHTRDPDIAEFKRWDKQSGGRVAIITLAPERAGSIDFIRQVGQMGVKVAMGHTVASPDKMAAAVLAGVDMSTHLGNGAHAMIHRWDNYIFRQLVDDRLWAGVIADGDHLPDSNLRLWFRAKGWRRIILVSDVSPQAGQAPGVYERRDWGQVLVEPNGRICVNDGSGNLAGAGHLLDRGVAKALQIGQFNLAQCLAMATENPATYMGLDHLGTLLPGKQASIFLFEKEVGFALKVRHTILAGQVIYSG